MHSINKLQSMDLESRRANGPYDDTHGASFVDIPPSPGQIPDEPMSAGSTTQNPALIRLSSGKKLDPRLFIYLMAAIFTLAMLAFSMAMICWHYDTQIWLPIITFSVGVWTGQLPGVPKLRSGFKGRNSRQ